jgi:hypothetical protein
MAGARNKSREDSEETIRGKQFCVMKLFIGISIPRKAKTNTFLNIWYGSTTEEESGMGDISITGESPTEPVFTFVQRKFKLEARSAIGKLI